jgi:hypothetical protein
MSSRIAGLILFFLAWLGRPQSIHPAAGLRPVDDRAELESPQFRYVPLEGLGVQAGVTRRDPSDVIRVRGVYYVWYTKVEHRPGVYAYPSGYSGAIWYATSPDGMHWKEKGQSLTRGSSAAFDSGGVFTPNILEARGRYYLFYTAIRNPVSADEPTAIGEAVAAAPGGPWKKLAANPVLVPSRDPREFDSFRIDDACMITRHGNYWLYYKGRQQGHTPQETKWGVAIASQPGGPYTKSAANPVVQSGHEVLVWPDRDGVAALVGPTGPERNTIQYAEDGLHFRVISHIVSPPAAPGAYRPDAFRDTGHASCIQWGISMRGSLDPYLVRWEYVQRGKETE